MKRVVILSETKNFSFLTSKTEERFFAPLRNDNSSVPLYRSGVLVGGPGISGDGVDQDDFVAAGGSASFEALAAIRADQVTVQGVRLPYLKFPSNPTN